MRRSSFFSFLWFVLILGVSAQQPQLSIADLPPCGLTCLLQTVPASGCSFTDNACICGNAELRQTSANCLRQNCSMSDTLTVAKIQANICDLPKNNLGKLVKVIAISVDGLAALVVLLRFIGRKMAGDNLKLDDYLLGLAVLILVPTLYTSVTMVMDGFGKHVYQLTDGALLKILRKFWIATLLYVFNLGLIKMAVLVFYHRLFPHDRFRYATWTSMVLVSVSTMIIILFAVFQCTPIPSYWDMDIGGKCININAVAYAGGAVSIFSDILIVALPIPVISSLQLSFKKKLGVVGMFALGSFGCVVSIIRLQSLVSYGDTVDPTYDLVMAVIWSALELTIAIICASFPALRRLFAVLFPRIFGTSNGKSSSEYSKPSKPGRMKSWYAPGSFATASATVSANEPRGDFAERGVEEVELEGRPRGKGRAIIVAEREVESGVLDARKSEMGGLEHTRRGEKIGGARGGEEIGLALGTPARERESEQTYPGRSTKVTRSNTLDSVKPLILPEFDPTFYPESVNSEWPPTAPPKDDGCEQPTKRGSRRLSRLGLGGWMGGERANRRDSARAKERNSVQQRGRERTEERNSVGSGIASGNVSVQTSEARTVTWYDSDSIGSRER